MQGIGWHQLGAQTGDLAAEHVRHDGTDSGCPDQPSKEDTNPPPHFCFSFQASAMTRRVRAQLGGCPGGANRQSRPVVNDQNRYGMNLLVLLQYASYSRPK